MTSKHTSLFLALTISIFFIQGLYSQIETPNGVYLAPYIAEGEFEIFNSESEIMQKSTACSNTTEGTIGLVDCADIGTPAYGAATITASVDSEVGTTAPTLPCGPGMGNGSWHQFDLEAGVDQVTIDYAGGFAGAGGFSELWMSFYQGPNCASLTNVGCGQIVDKSGPSLLLLELGVSGLDDTQPLWVFTWGNKAYDIDFDFTGVGPTPVNDVCAGAGNASAGCNLGATGAAFTAPSSSALGAGACSGGTWYSNENTVFYSFVATSTAGDLSVSSLACNDGTAGEAQFGVWDDCASVGTYGGSFLGCAVGSGNITLPTLTIGNSYIIAVDGQAGDACTWDFTSTGIALPIQLISFDVIKHDRYNRIDWVTANEVNCSHYELEKSYNGKDFNTIEIFNTIQGSSDSKSYGFNDFETQQGATYYRIKQVDFDGNYSYHGPRLVNRYDTDKLLIYPNPAISTLNLTFNNKSQKNYFYTITNSMGSAVITDNFTPSYDNQSLELNVGELSAGVYNILITTQNNLRIQGRFLKQ